MRDETELREALRALFKTQRLAVLATHTGGHPYTSLVAFASTEDLRHMLFATTRATRKYANLTADPRVSLLVDNRSNQAADFRNAIATTAMGTAVEVEGPGRDPLLRLYLHKHPYLEEFVSSPTCALFRVDIETYFTVKRFQNVMELHVKT